MEHPSEKKNRRIAFWMSSGIIAGLLLLFIILVAWRAPDPPEPKYGIQVDFGLSNTGSGDAPVPSPAPVETPTPEPQTNPTPEPTPEPVVESTPVTTPTPEPVSTAESADVVPETVTEPTPDPEPTPEPEPEPEPVINQNALLGPTNDASGGSQGDAGGEGDQGQPDGTQSDNYTGPSGTGNGDGLDIPGWEWEAKPTEPNISATSGWVKFKITSDRYGRITRVELVSGTLNASDERALREAIYTGKLRPEGGGSSASGGVGFFTWRIKSN